MRSGESDQFPRSHGAQLTYCHRKPREPAEDSGHAPWQQLIPHRNRETRPPTPIASSPGSASKSRIVPSVPRERLDADKSCSITSELPPLRPESNTTLLL